MINCLQSHDSDSGLKSITGKGGLLCRGICHRRGTAWGRIDGAYPRPNTPRRIEWNRTTS